MYKVFISLRRGMLKLFEAREVPMRCKDSKTAVQGVCLSQFSPLLARDI
jgi:hypothetical protein